MGTLLQRPLGSRQKTEFRQLRGEEVAESRRRRDTREQDETLPSSII